MLSYLGIKAEISGDSEKISRAEKLILSGVGSFDAAIENLDTLGLKDILHNKVKTGQVPVLGICLGMQLMGKTSGEGKREGLEWIDARSVRFDPSIVRIPHMSWNHVTINENSRLFHGIGETPRFYFAHSYYVVAGDSGIVTATSSYGVSFAAAIESGNIAGVQFHPEKSHRYGMTVLRNFAKLF